MISAKPEWVVKLEAEPCTCIACSACHGTGTVYFDLSGRYLGNSRMDDLAEADSCEFCRSGVSEECERCIQLNDFDQRD